MQEAFVKIKEQAKAHLETKGELATGLNLVNSTNLEFFLAKNKAEIFRLKGDFHLKLNDTEGANIAYSNAITLFKNLPKGWISWGNYCDMVFLLIRCCFFSCAINSLSPHIRHYILLSFCRHTKIHKMKSG